MGENPFFSIITITYNAEEKIRDTIKSVLLQKYIDYEYIIVDGKSTDNTMAVIKNYERSFIEKGISYKYISEKDNGIYDAMNKGVSIAKGRWVYFLNAGDYLYDCSVLGEVKEADIDNSIGIIYGDTIIYKKNGLVKYDKSREIERIVSELPFCHQSSFTKRELLLMHPFDISYRICADYEFFTWCYTNKCIFRYISIPVSRYEFGGFSMCEDFEIDLLRERNISRKENHMISIEEYNSELERIEKLKNKRSVVRNIKRFIPDSVLAKRIYIKNLKSGWMVEENNNE